MSRELLKQALDALIASRMYVCGEGSDEEIGVHQSAIAALEAELAKPDTRSFGEVHPRNPNAKCGCEHWVYCKECHPTAFLGATT